MEFYRNELLKRINESERKSYFKKTSLYSCDINNSRILQFCSILYSEYQNELKIHFDDFIAILFYQNPTSDQLFWRSFYAKKYNKNKKSYRRKKEHKKKILTEDIIRKRDWRKKKKYKDERSKNNHFDYSDYYREFNYRSHRRWEKMRLRAGDYDLEKKWKKHNHFNTEWLW